MAVLNSAILERCWLNGSSAFQQRIPDPSQTAYANVVEHLFAPYNNDLFNEFSMLLNGLNSTYIESKRWEHGLRSLKKPAMEWGNTERRVAVKYLKAHAGKWSDQDLLKVERPEFVEWFYSVAEPRKYSFSWDKPELAQVFAADGRGYEELLTATVTQMLNSAELDEMLIMINMFAEADKRMGGLYRKNLANPVTDKASAEELVVAVRSIAKRMAVAPTMLYNHIPVPVTETPETLVLWLTPEASAVIDVSFLSTIFNLDKASINYRVIEIPEFPIPNVQAALTSEDFIYYRDFRTGLEPPFYNPDNRTLKYYYWADAMIGVNPAANCVLFTAGEESSVIPTVTVTPTTLAFTPAAYTVAPGGEVQLNLKLTGTVSPEFEGVEVKPSAGLFSVAASGVSLSMRTYVDDWGVLHVADDVPAGTVLTVSAKSTYINPSGATSELTASAEVSVTAESGEQPADPQALSAAVNLLSSGEETTNSSATATKSSKTSK